MRLAPVVAWIVVGCTTTAGSLDLELSLPTDADLRPAGMTTITVLATAPNMAPLSSTSVIDKSGHSISGDLPIEKSVEIDVLLHDVSNRLVGLGQAPQLVDIARAKATTLTIPVRRPFVYAASGNQLYSYDPTLDPRDAKFQGQISGLNSPQLAVSVGGDRLVVASMGALQIVDTATHKVTGSPIAIPGSIRDATAIPGTRRVAIGHSAGISIVDIDSGTVQNASTQAVDRITVGPDASGHTIAYGLVGRVAPPLGPLDPCSGTSALVQVDVDAPAAAQPMALTAGVADIAAAPNQAVLFAALPCVGKVQRLNGGEFKDFSLLERASALAVTSDRVWAAGAKAATPVCADSSGAKTACTPNAPANCPQTNAPVSIAWADPAAASHVIVQSIPIAGGTPIQLDVQARRETMIDVDDQAGAHAQVLHSLGVAPIDLVVLPGGQYVGLVTTNLYYIVEAVQRGSGLVILPCIKTTTADWMLVDMASSSVAQRVRTSCQPTVGPADVFRNWRCDAPPAGEQSTFMDYQPISVGSLFGAR